MPRYIGKTVMIRFIRPGQKVPRATLTYAYPPPNTEFWNTIKQWLDGKIKLGRAKKVLTVNIILSENQTA